MILLVTPTEIEAKHLQLGSDFMQICCGIGKDSARIVRQTINENLFRVERVILFGCCGLVDSRLKLGKLYVPEIICYKRDGIHIDPAVIKMFQPFDKIKTVKRCVTVDAPCHESWEREKFQLSGYSYVTMEDFHIAQVCQELQIPFLPVRYGEDYCDRKMIPIPGVNHFYHKWNHWSMQRRMSAILQSLSEQLYGWMNDEY